MDYNDEEVGGDGSEGTPEPEAAAAETAEQETAGTEPDPYLSVLNKYRGTLTPEQLEKAVNQGFFFETDQGKNELRQRAEEMLLNDRGHLKKAMERGLTDKKTREFTRQFLGALKPNADGESSQSYDGDEAQAGNGQFGELKEMLLEMNTRLQSVEGVARGASNGVGLVTNATIRAAELQQLASQDEDVARTWPWLTSEVNDLMERRPREFSGPGAAARAANFILDETRRKAASIGATVPKKGPRLPGNGRGGTIVKKQDSIDPKKVQELVAKRDWDAIGKLHSDWMAANPE